MRRNNADMRTAFKIRMRDERGFSLVELIIAMTVFVFVIAAATGMFVPLVTQFKQQSTVSETQTESLFGLDILRVDIEHAGQGLPWDVLVNSEDENVDIHPPWSSLANYTEAASGGPPNPADFNDSTRDLDLDGNKGEAPRGVISGDNVGAYGSDYLVVKSTCAAINDTVSKWTHITRINAATYLFSKWADLDAGYAYEDLENGNYVIALKPEQKDSKDNRYLIVDGSTDPNPYPYHASFSWTAFPDRFTPVNDGETYIIFGLSEKPATPAPPRMPFNRADFLIKTVNVPKRCAPKTGVLEKGVVKHADGGLLPLPLLDCVADFQVVFGVDITTPDPDGTMDCYTNDFSKLATTLGFVDDAESTRDRIKEVRVYVLAHEGKYDATYTFRPAVPNTIRVGEPSMADCGGGTLGRDFDLTTIGSDWTHYRWKVYPITTRPSNLKLEGLKESET